MQLDFSPTDVMTAVAAAYTNDFTKFLEPGVEDGEDEDVVATVGKDDDVHSSDDDVHHDDEW